MKKIVELISIVETREQLPGIWYVRPHFRFDDGSDETLYVKLHGVSPDKKAVDTAVIEFIRTHNSFRPVSIPTSYPAVQPKVPLKWHKRVWTSIKRFFGWAK